jgi:stress-induced morphogen
MPMTVEQIEQFIKEAIPDAAVEIEDLKGDGDHYSATVISKSFSGKTRVEQHKMVYDAFGGKMGSDLHALKLKTLSE